MISPLTLSLIKRFENFSPKMYLDAAGLPTIGYGHLIVKGEEDLADLIMTEDEASAFLIEDVKKKACIEKYIDPTVYASLTTQQKSALISLCYNIGLTSFSSSSLLKKLNENDFDKTLDQFAVWRKANDKIINGLVKRRLTEQLFFYGKTLDPKGSVPSSQWKTAKNIVNTDANWLILTPAQRTEATQIFKEFTL